MTKKLTDDNHPFVEGKQINQCLWCMRAPDAHSTRMKAAGPAERDELIEILLAWRHTLNESGAVANLMLRAADCLAARKAIAEWKRASELVSLELSDLRTRIEEEKVVELEAQSAALESQLAERRAIYEELRIQHELACEQLAAANAIIGEFSNTPSGAIIESLKKQLQEAEAEIRETAAIAESNYSSLEKRLAARDEDANTALFAAIEAKQENGRLTEQLRKAREALKGLTRSNRSPLRKCWCPQYVDVTKGHTAACLQAEAALRELDKSSS